MGEWAKLIETVER